MTVSPSTAADSTAADLDNAADLDAEDVRLPVTGFLIWLGGGRDRDVTEGHERASYSVAGLAVALLAVVTGSVTALALTDSGSRLGVGFSTLVVALLAGAIGRALATTTPGGAGDRVGLVARIGVAVLVGVLIAELASIVVFGGTVDRMLDERARLGIESAPGVVATRTALESARDDRTALERTVATAQADIDRALVIARCEFNPTPGCPRTHITGVPGLGPETRTAEAMLDDARAAFAGALGRIAAADSRIAENQKAVTDAESGAFATADRGIGARWQTMNDHTLGAASALFPRALILVAFVLLALLPLILRGWRGETSLDRHAAFRAVRERAELDVATARQHESDTGRQHESDTARQPAHIDTGITRQPAELDAIEPAWDRWHGIVCEAEIVPPTPAAPITRAALMSAPPAPTPKGGLELPLIGQVPFADTAARLLRPLVPALVAEAIDNATRPSRLARVPDSRSPVARVPVYHVPGSHIPGYHLRPGPPAPWQTVSVPASVVDALGG